MTAVFTRALIAVCLLATPAMAHEWYPPSCCSERDCVPLSEAEVKETPDGWRVRGRDLVRYGKETGPSPDGKYHGCFLPTRALNCFFAPPRGF